MEPDLNNKNIPSFEELSENTIKQALLVSFFRANTTPMYHVERYQSRMVKLASPMVGLADQFIFHELHNCDKTTNAGALRAMI